MHIKTSSAPSSGAIGIIGTGVAMFCPDEKWIGLVLIFLGFIVFIFDISIDGNNLRARFPDTKGGKVGPIILMMVGVFIFASGGIWYYSKQKIQIQKEIEITHPIDGSVFVEITNFDFLPQVMPPNGSIDAMFLSSAALENGVKAGHPQLGAGRIVGNPGSKINWPKPAPNSTLTKSPMGNRLEITNDTGSPILELTIPIRVEYGNMPNQRKVDSNIITIRLDPGTNNRRVIYILNQISDGGLLKVGDTAMAIKLGDSIMRNVRITKPQDFIFQMGFLTPFKTSAKEIVTHNKKTHEKNPNVSKP